MKSDMSASVAADLVARTLSLPVETPTAEVAPAPAVVEPAVVEPAAEPPDPTEQTPVWPPPPSPPPKTFDATALAARFMGPPAEPVAAPAPAPVDSGLDIPAAPPATLGRAPTQAELFTWARLRTEATTYHKKAAEADAAIELAHQESKKLSEDLARVAAEKAESDKRITELTDTVGKLNLAESPEFKARYDLKRAELAAELSAALTRYAKIDADKSGPEAERILKADPATLADMVSDLNPAVGGMIMAIANRVGGIDAARDQELANWRQSSAANGYEESRRGVVELAEVRRQYADKALDLAKSYGNPVYTATDPQAKAEAEKLEQAFRGFIQTATEEQLVAAAAEGFSASQVYEVVNQQAEEISQLRDQIAGRFRAAQPPLFAMAPYTPSAPPAPPPSNVTPVAKRVTPEDLVRATFARGALQ